MTTAEHGFDPVLLQLRDVMRAQDLNRSALAARIGVSRSAVTSWMLELTATQQGERAGSSARSFRFTRQPAEVQERIAGVLGRPVGELTVLSRGTADDGRAVDPAEWTGASSVIEALAARSVARSLQILPQQAERAPEHDVAAVAQSVPGVVATAVVEDVRGVRYPTPWQYHVVVLARPGADRAALRATVDDALAHAALPASWENPALEPAVSLRSRGHPHEVVGALVVRWVEGSRGPRSGRLLPATLRAAVPATDTASLAVFAGSAYSAYQIAPGLLAHASGAGFLRGGDLVRRYAEMRARRFGDPGSARLGLVDERDAAEAGFLLRNAIDLLGDAAGAGAWTMSVDMRTAAAYPPLLDTLATAPPVLVTCRLGPSWRRLAAWRLASAERLAAGEDVVDPPPSDGPVAVDRSVFNAHQRTAEVWLDRFDRWEVALDALEERRAGHGITIRLPLDELPPDYRWRTADGTDGTGAPPDEPVVFLDDVDPLVDARVEATADAVAALASASGTRSDDERRELVRRLSDDPPALRSLLADVHGERWASADGLLLGRSG